jgi:hypothetical protein
MSTLAKLTTIGRGPLEGDIIAHKTPPYYYVLGYASNTFQASSEGFSQSAPAPLLSARVNLAQFQDHDPAGPPRQQLLKVFFT